jgi:hypothetical protein
LAVAAGASLGPGAGASMPVVALAAIVPLRLTPTAEAVAFLTAPATVAFLRPVGAVGSSAVALRLAG